MKKTTTIDFKFDDIEMFEELNITIPEPNKKDVINNNIIKVVKKPSKKKTNGNKYARKELF